MKKYGLAAFLLLSIARVCEGQPVGDCEHGDAAATLDVNNVHAAVYNNGNLFWRGRWQRVHATGERARQRRFRGPVLERRDGGRRDAP